MLFPDTLVHQRYRVVRLIGRGGMGAVYEALDERLQSRVALKQTLGLDVGFAKAFQREAHLLASLRHPALPLVTDFFSEDAGQFLVMQFIPGDDLATLINARSRPLPLDQAMVLAEQLLKVLVYLHAQQPPIIHHDIKPQNLKQTPDGDLVLLDFGLAKLMRRQHVSEGADELAPTEPSLSAFTPQYAALEQIEGVDTDPRSDLYAASATLYHLLTGVAPASALARVNAVVARRPDPLRPAHELNPSLPRPMSDVLRQGLALHAGDRPADATEMLRLLSEAQHSSSMVATEPVSQVDGRPGAGVGLPPLPDGRQSRSTRNNITWWLVGLTLGVALLAAPFLWQLRAPTTEGNPTAISEPMGHGQAPEPAVIAPDPTAEPAATAAVSGAATIASGQPAPVFYRVPVDDYANAELDFESPPVGEVTLGAIPFQLSERAFKSQSSFPPGESAPTQAVIALRVPQAYRLHLLLNTGNGFTLYQDQVVGEVNVECGGTTVKVAALRLGREVREWHSAGKVVAEASRPRAVWQGARTDAPQLDGHLDLLSLDLPPICREGVLSAVEVVDVSVDSVNSLDPALNLAGLTVEHYR